MLVSEFDFPLPEEQIAQQPPAERGSSRMLRLDRETGRWQDDLFAHLPSLLRPGDVLVLNDSRVIPARLFGRRGRRPGETSAPDGRVEALLTAPRGDWEWTALVRPGRRLRPGDALEFGDAGQAPALRAEVVAAGERGERTLRFDPVPDFERRLDAIGHMPLPPYIRREDGAADRERYQTVYARVRGSAAAPTAGLHFTPAVLEAIRAAGVTLCSLTLHVGLGTFQPVQAADTAGIRLHEERYELPAESALAIERARAGHGRVIAVGTTTVRTLEHCASLFPGGLQPHSGSTRLFLAPGHRFRLVDAMLTNFHLPQSTLLMLVAAFAGREPVLAAYRHAVEAGYRFFSYGDCMFIS